MNEQQNSPSPWQNLSFGNFGQNAMTNVRVLVDGFNALYKQVNTQKRLISLLECDEEMISNFTISQLSQLKDQILERIDMIDNVHHN